MQAALRAPTTPTIATQTDAINPAALPLLDFIPTLNSRYERPDHLAPLVELLVRAETEEVRALVSLPPQHGKSQTILAGLVWLMRRNPTKRHAYASFGAKVAHRQSLSCRDMALTAKVNLRDDARAVGGWMTREGGGLFATSLPRGQFTSVPVDGVLVVDDPHANREDAESALARGRVHDWFTSTALARVHPGASVIVCHTRWHPDDLIGKLSKETTTGPDGRERPAWEIVNLPAIKADGSALWHQRPLSYLEKYKRNEYDWWSLYMGSPRPRGSSVFSGVRFFDRLPIRYRVGKGIDLAYTAKTHADWSVGITLLESTDESGKPLYYVVDVRRKQAEVPAFMRELHAANMDWPGSWHWFCSTTEKGLAQLIASNGVMVEPVVATADKFVRAQPVSAEWNAGRVLVPRNMAALLGERASPEDFKRSPMWLKTFVDEVGAFTGVGDSTDDQVDALASAFERIRHQQGPPPKTVTGSGSRFESDERGFG